MLHRRSAALLLVAAIAVFAGLTLTRIPRQISTFKQMTNSESQGHAKRDTPVSRLIKWVETPEGFTATGFMDGAQPSGKGFHNLAKPVIPSLPNRFSKPMRVRSGSAEVAATPVSGKDARGMIAPDGSLLYADAFEGCDVSYRCEALKTEEFILVKGANAQTSWSWELDTQGLSPRLTPMHTIELVDENKVPRLRINAPEGSDAAGKILRVGDGLTLSIDGSRLTLAAKLEGCKFPVAIDPSWSSTGNMSTAREQHVTVTLPSGQVLAMGGTISGGTPLASCELFDPGSGTWSVTGSMSTPRVNFTATILTTNGNVVVTGGQITNTFVATDAVEVFDPISGTWSLLNPMSTARAGHTATLLPNDQILVAGGNSPLSSCEIFDGGSGNWSATGNLSTARGGHTATLLNNGLVLAAGGNTQTCELYDPIAGSWSNTGSMSQSRVGHSAILLSSGSVLVVGNSMLSTNICELYAPGTGIWTNTGSISISSNSSLTAPLAGGSKVLLTGTNSTTAQIYDMASGVWTNTVSSLQARSIAAAAVLNDGRVLVSGGSIFVNPLSQITPTAEIFDAKATPLPQSISLYENKSVLVQLQANSLGTPVFAIAAPPSNGVLTGAVPNVTYTPNAGYFGPDSFSFSATDSFGSNTAAVSITVLPNTAPVLDTNGQFSVTSINENVAVASNPGTLVSAMLASAGGPYNVPASLALVPSCSALQSDGKLLLGGTLPNAPGSTDLVRLNTDGSIDAAFAANVGTGFGPANIFAIVSVRAIAIQSNGKIVVAGSFFAYNGTPVSSGIVRLNADGTLDTTFNAGLGLTTSPPGSGSGSAVAIQADGSILVAGSFTMANGASHTNLVRFFSNGSVDPTYNPSVTGFGAGASPISAIALQADGKALIAGSLSTVNLASKSGIARLNLDGTLDTAYSAVGAGSSMALLIQPDGKAVIAANPGIVLRYNADGTTDLGFSTGSGAGIGGFFDALALQSDGKLIVGGNFSSFNGQSRNDIVRLNTNGSVDLSFNPGSGLNGAPNSINIQSDGKILTAGSFTTYGGLPCNHVVRILPTGAGENSRISDPDTGALQGIAVIGADNTDGVWQFSTNGTTFTNFGVLSSSSATLLASDANTRLRFLPNANFFGTVSPGITFHAWDQNTGTNGQVGVDTTVNGGTSPFSVATAPASITVNFINQAPTFVVGPNITTTEASAVNTFPNFITGFSPGPPNESTQAVKQYIVTNDSVPTQVGKLLQNAFSAQPAIDNSGTLTFTPADNIDVNTVVTVTVRVQDNGGTANGGNDTSAPQTFTITLTPIADTLVVTNTLDDGSANTLRDCMNRARSGDTITFDPDVFDLTNAQAATVINLQDALPDMSHGSVTIDAADRKVTLNGAGAGQCNGFTITSANNVLRGLSIIGFTNAGVAVQGIAATGNIVGGDRSVGLGPNGQGLRIGSCGAFGINLDQGACGNTVKGCWVGLDTSGTAEGSNLAGIVIQGAACNNIIGSTTPGEANAISGNTFEGITITGAGTDNNAMIGNLVGVSAVETEPASRDVGSRVDLTNFISGRSPVQNGASGIFLSRGTNGSVVGGKFGDDDNTIALKANTIGFNVGNGIEVRAKNSQKNASRGNRISQNKGGGIGLFDGSNGGIKAPSFSSVLTIPGRSGRSVGGRDAIATLHVVGIANNGDGTPGDGVVEFFNDPASQGQVPLGRSAVVNGSFDVMVDVSDLSLSLNATYTDTNGNTSPFAVFGPPPPASATTGGTPPLPDPTTSGLDGLIGIDPNNPSDAPAGTGTLQAAKFTVVLNFAKTGHDSVDATFAVKLPDGFAPAGATLGVVYDANTDKVTLDAKGHSPRGGMAVKITSKNGVGVVQVSSKSKSWVAGFDNSGLISKTTAKAGETITVPIGLALVTSAGAKYLYTGTVDVTYKATDKKNGKAVKK